MSIFKGKNKSLIILFAVCTVMVAFPDLVVAEGRSLESASTSAVTTATTVARAISALGMLLSAILWNLPGMTHYARKLMGGSLAGAVCAFGGPAFIRTIAAIFG